MTQIVDSNTALLHEGLQIGEVIGLKYHQQTFTAMSYRILIACTHDYRVFLEAGLTRSI